MRKPVVLKYLNFILACVFALVYILGKLPPHEKFNLWLIYFSIPFVLSVNVVLLLVMLVLRNTSVFFYLGALLLGGNYITSTIGIKSIFRKKENYSQPTLKVSNYNVGGFNLSLAKSAAEDSGYNELKKWILSNEADIQCYQEFQYFPGKANADIVENFTSRGYHHYFSGRTNWDRSELGVLILSKFPLIAYGDIMKSSNGFNRITFADINFNDDTLRIINVHLESMSLKKYNPVYSRNLQDGKRNIKMVLSKLRLGMFERSEQIKNLIRFIETSPHPVICVGDFNELPYSYSYQLLKKEVKNAFEEVGRGFGFTYSGKTLGMLRIDNQFYSSELNAVSFETLNAVRYTDHFPLVGRYQTGL